MNSHDEQPILLRRITLLPAIPRTAPLVHRSPLQPVAGLRALRFTQRLINRAAIRHTRRAVDALAPVERVWLARWRGLEANPTMRTLRLSVAPRLHLALFQQTSVEQSVYPLDSHSPGSSGPPTGNLPGYFSIPRPPHAAGVLWQTLVRVQRTLLPVERLVERLVARKERQEPPPPSELVPELPSGRPLPAPPILRQLPRITAPSAVQGAPEVQEISPPGSRRPEAPFRPDPEELLAAIDVNRLTDQVIQAIDRRVIAQRERLGWSGSTPSTGRS